MSVAASPLGRSGQTLVLVVERDPDTRAALARAVGARPGVTVVAVGTASEALAGGRVPRFGLCLLRHELSGVDGLTLGAMIRSLNADARLVLLRSTRCPRTASLAFEHGFEAVVQIPLAPGELDSLLAAV